MDKFVGASTRERFYELIQEKHKIFFTSEFYKKTLNIFNENLGKENVFDWEDSNAVAKRKKVKRTYQSSSLLTYVKN